MHIAALHQDANIILSNLDLACLHRLARMCPQGVEKVHYECKIDIESSDQG